MIKDLVIIGGGPGGYVAAIRAAQLGMQVTLVEKDELGGTCLNRGCIPTKAYYQNATALRFLGRSAEFGITGGPASFDLAQAYRRKEQVVQGLVTGVAGLLKANGVEVIRGSGQILAPGRVAVGNTQIETRRILLATGSISSRLNIPGADLPGVLDSDEILGLQTLPRRLAVIGGGVIGLELASIFRSFGSEVTVAEYLPDLINTVDREISRRLRVYLRKQGIDVLLGAAVQEIAQTDGELRLQVETRKGQLTVAADQVLMATGRRPCVSCVNLCCHNIALNERGFVQVDENYETSVPGIFAIGDLVGRQMLAHVASEEGRVAVERMAGLQAEVAYHAVPAVIFTFPEIATVGLSEEAAQAAGISYRVGKCQFAANSKAVAMGEPDGLVKVLADEAGTIIGVHILGPGASDLIQTAAVMVKQRLTIEEAVDTIYAHPTLSEALHEAVLDVAGQAIHLLPR